jgi:hypothetical protein
MAASPKPDKASRSQKLRVLLTSLANEPNFLGRMRQKYGDHVIDSALRFHAPKQNGGLSPAALFR